MWDPESVVNLIHKTHLFWRFILLCILSGFLAERVASYSPLDFLMPPDWFAHGIGQTAQVIEPINVIISAQSNVNPFDILTKLSWADCQVTMLQANVQPGQQNPVPQMIALRNGGCIELFFGGNHMRAWAQTQTNRGTAYFIAASMEHDCLSDVGSKVPRPLHCIDSNGFNAGRDGLTASFVANHNAAVSHSYVLKQELAQLYPKGAGVDFGGGDA